MCEKDIIDLFIKDFVQNILENISRNHDKKKCSGIITKEIPHVYVGVNF